MNKLLLIAGGIFAYTQVTKMPKISIEEKDILNKTALLKIGSKTVNYVATEGEEMMIPKVTMLYDASIKPIDSGFVILIQKNGKTKFQENISWL